MGNCCECQRQSPLVKRRKGKKKPSDRRWLSTALPSISKLNLQETTLSFQMLDLSTFVTPRLDPPAPRRAKNLSFLEEAKKNIHYSPREFQECYEVLGEIGRGTQAVVLEVRHVDSGDCRVAKRITLKSEEELKAVEKEILILQELDHPNILKIFEYFRQEDTITLVTDYVKGGSLYDAVYQEKQIFPEPVVADIARQLFSTLAYLHNKQILHCDIKPENILYQERDDKFFIKLIDFGVARDIGSEEDQLVSGTFGYMSPEHEAGAPEMKSDVWAAGVVCYTLLSGLHPFEDLEGNAKELSFPEEAFQQVSEQAIALMQMLLNQDPWNRPSADDILQDPWLLEHKMEVVIWEMEAKPDPPLEKLMKYIQKTPFIRAVLYYISALRESEDLALRGVFEATDTQNDGELSIQELFAGFVKLGHSEERAKDMVNEIFTAIYPKVCVSYKLFIAANLDPDEVHTEGRLKLCFDYIDKQEKGTVDKAAVANFVNPEMGEEEAQDENLGLGGNWETLNYEEFVQLVSAEVPAIRSGRSSVVMEVQ